MQITMCGYTDQGRIRAENQDAFAVLESEGMAMVCDGVGGRRGGAVASKTVIQALRKASSQFHRIHEDEIQPFAMNIIDNANSKLIEMGQENSKIKGMGTTLEWLIFHDSHAYICHIGDSRTYLFHEDRLFQLTIDHNIGTFLERGWLQHDQLPLKYRKSSLTRAMGIQKHLEVDIYQKKIQEGEIYLTASDGLFDMLADATILEILSKNRHDLHQAAHQLIHAANNNGGKDNITLTLCLVGPS